MPTLTINGNIRTNTAAGWAADATVYSAKTILVTTDAYWGSTDQRKFKLADGVQTWSNLDYPPFEVATDTLSEVLTAGNSTGGLDIVSPDGQQYVRITDAIAELYSNGGVNGAFAGTYAVDGQASMEGGDNSGDGNSTINATQNKLSHTALINLDAPAVRLTQETASRVAILDASKDIVGADTATYPSLTELSYVKGVTSAIQTQLNGKKGVIITLFPAAQFSPSDLATYYFGSFPASTVQSSAGFGDSIAPVAFTIKSVYGISYQVAGSNENVTYEIGVNGSYTTISSTVQLTATNVEISVTGLNIAVNAGDNITIRMVCPTWVTTNPANMRATFSIYGE